METLAYLKAKTSETSEDVLNACILDAEDTVTGYCMIDEVPDELQVIVRKLALRAYNQRGIEGTSSYSEGGISASLITELTAEEKALLNRHRIFKVGEYVEETTA